MFRALVVASALLTATLAAVLFMPGIGREGESAEGATTGEMLRSGGLMAEAGPVTVAEDVLPEPEPEPEPELVAEAEAPQEAGPLADAGALAAAVALSAPAMDDVAGEDALAAMPVVQPEAEVAGASDVEAMSRGVLAGLGHEIGEVAEPEPTVELASTEPLVRVERSHISRASSNRAMKEAAAWTTDYVLIGLGHGPRKVTTPLEDAQEWSTAYVLNGLGAARSGTPERSAGAVTLEDVIARAIAEGRSDAYLVELIDQLSAAGQLDAPAALLRPDGQVDSALVLNALVNASTAKAKAEERQAAASTGGTARPAPAQRPTAARRLKAPVTYTVKQGDSLAAIAYRFYGLTSRYTMIFEANRERLPSPDEIKAGQRLTIPAG